MNLKDINVEFVSDNLKMKDMDEGTIYAVYQGMGYSDYALLKLIINLW